MSKAEEYAKAFKVAEDGRPKIVLNNLAWNARAYVNSNGTAKICGEELTVEEVLRLRDWITENFE